MDPRKQYRTGVPTGHPWNSSSAGAVYKTTDGGKTWNNVLAGQPVHRLRDARLGPGQ